MPQSPSDPWSWRTEFLHGVSDMLDGLTDVEAESAGDLRITSIELGLPVELAVGVDDQGVLRLASSPPTQRLDTSVQPVFHTLRLRMVVDRAE